MGIRQTIQRHKRVATGAAIGLVAIGLWLIGYQLFGDKRSRQAPQGWFTTDDGATLFKDDISRATPFDHDGRAAVGAVPFTADGGMHQWVQYLTKSESTGAPPRAVPDMPGVITDSTVGLPLVKKPGSTAWVRYTDRRAVEIVTPKAPAGMGTGQPEQVYP